MIDQRDEEWVRFYLGPVGEQTPGEGREKALLCLKTGVLHIPDWLRATPYVCGLKQYFSANPKTNLVRFTVGDENLIRVFLDHEQGCIRLALSNPTGVVWGEPPPPTPEEQVQRLTEKMMGLCVG